MQEQMSNVSRELETLRKNQKVILDNKKAAIERKNAFDGLISGLETAKEPVNLNIGVIFPPQIEM